MRRRGFRVFLIITLLLAAAAAFRTIDIGRELGADEGMVFKISSQDLGGLIPLLKDIDMYPPLTYIFIHYLMKISPSLILIRGYFILFGIGCCILTYLLARELFGEGTALLALVFSAFSPLLIFASQYVRSYIDSAFWMLLSTLFMLRIIRGRTELLNWAGFVAASVLSAYTFYFSILLVMSQFIYVNIFIRRNRTLLLKWYLAFFVVALSFLPWLPSMLYQFRGATSLAYDWSDKGFKIGFLRFGLYARNILSIAGFDPAFMNFRGGVLMHFAKPLLWSSVISIFIVVILFSSRCLRLLKERFPSEPYLSWFLPFFIGVPLIISWLSAGATGLFTNAKYLLVFNAFFLVLVAFFIHAWGKASRFFAGLSASLIIIIFSFRIPFGVSAEIESKKADLFLSQNLNSKSDCLVCLRLCPALGLNVSAIRAMDYVELKKGGSGYKFISSAAKKELEGKVKSCRGLWFYRVGGNIEVFGANKLLADFFSGQGYKAERKAVFNNIEIIRYERDGQ